MVKNVQEKLWKLGEDRIEETNVYKYLGVYFSRSLKFTYHIENFLKDGVQRKINYMTRVLGEHGNFNRLSFGDALWNSVLKPSIAHGCAIWLPSSVSSVKSIDSWQYQAGKVILKTKLNSQGRPCYQNLVGSLYPIS